MIYILEDDESIRKLVVYGLESQGFTVEGFALPSAFHRAMERALRSWCCSTSCSRRRTDCTFCAICAPPPPRGRCPSSC